MVSASMSVYYCLRKVKDSFCSDLHDIQFVRQIDILIVGVDFSAQLGLLSPCEHHLNGHFGISTNRTNIANRLIQLCTDHNLFLTNNRCSHERLHLMITVFWLLDAV